MRLFTRRWNRLTALIPVLALPALMTFFFPSEGTDTIWKAYDAIQEGMTEAQVEGLLGGPPGWYARGPVTGCVAMTGEEREAFNRLMTKHWQTDDCLVIVGFDADGRVRCKFATVNQSRPLSLGERISFFFQQLLSFESEAP